MLGGGTVSSRFAVNNDSYDRAAFGMIKDQSHELKFTEASGEATLSTFSEVLQDTFSALYKAQPELNDDMTAGYELNRGLAGTLMDLREYKELRQFTKLDDWGSSMATATLAGNMVADLPSDVIDAANKSNHSRQQVERLMDVVEGLEDVIAEAEASGINTDDLRLKLGDAGERLDGAKSISVSASQEAIEAMAKNDDEVRQAVRNAVKNASEEGSEITTLVDSWGSEPGKACRLSGEDKIELARRVKGSDILKKVSQIVGRFQRLAIHKQKSRVKRGVTELVDIEQGRDLSRVLPSELSLLSTGREIEFYQKFTEDKLMQYRMEAREPQGKGPVVVCVDESGTMRKFDRNVWAKAFTIGLLTIAQKQKRDFVIIRFSRDVCGVVKFSGKTEPNPLEIMDYVEMFDGGGTNFQLPLSKAMESIEKPDSEFDLKKADIVFVTDDACSVDGAWLDSFLKRKESNGVKVYGIGIQTVNTSTLDEFSDSSCIINPSDDGQAIEVYGQI